MLSNSDRLILCFPDEAMEKFQNKKSWNVLIVAVRFSAFILFLHHFIVFKVWYKERLYCLIHEICRLSMVMAEIWRAQFHTDL